MKYYHFYHYWIIGIIILIHLGSNACSNQTDIVKDSILKGEIGTILDREFTPFCEDIIAAYDLPGLAVGIVKNNEIVFARSFGYKNIETMEPVSLTSLFHMASI